MIHFLGNILKICKTTCSFNDQEIQLTQALPLYKNNSETNICLFSLTRHAVDRSLDNYCFASTRRVIVRILRPQSKWQHISCHLSHHLRLCALRLRAITFTFNGTDILETIPPWIGNWSRSFFSFRVIIRAKRNSF